MKPFTPYWEQDHTAQWWYCFYDRQNDRRGRRRGTERVCALCGKTYVADNAAYKQGYVRHCSRSCGKKAGALTVTLKCETCADEFVRPAGEAARRNVRFCSNPCKFASRRRPVGSVVVVAQGYLDVAVAPGTPGAKKAGAGWAMKQHRLVMQEHLGRPLLDSETVHHINGDRADNRIANLQLRAAAHGAGQAVACLDCGSQRVGHVPLADAA